MREVRSVFMNMSMATKFDVTKFDGTRNFALWQTRVKDMLLLEIFSKGNHRDDYILLYLLFIKYILNNIICIN